MRFYKFEEMEELYHKRKVHHHHGRVVDAGFCTLGIWTFTVVLLCLSPILLPIYILGRLK